MCTHALSFLHETPSLCFPHFPPSFSRNTLVYCVVVSVHVRCVCVFFYTCVCVTSSFLVMSRLVLIFGLLFAKVRALHSHLPVFFLEYLPMGQANSPPTLITTRCVVRAHVPNHRTCVMANGLGRLHRLAHAARHCNFGASTSRRTSFLVSKHNCDPS